MPKAEVGSNKYLANKMRSKGLLRLRWYCQPCEKQACILIHIPSKIGSNTCQCRDANGFKCHVQSESHVRQMQLVGEDPRKYIQGFTRQFQNDFIQLLRVAHGEKFVGANRFYNEYIRDKEHIHMNATSFSSLTEFVKHLGREGIVNVKEDEKDGLMIAWRDTSHEAMRRRKDIEDKERVEARNGAGEDKMLKRMAKRAQEDAEAKAKAAEVRRAKDQPALPSLPAEIRNTGSPAALEEGKEEISVDAEAAREEAVPVKISFGLKPKATLGKAGLGQVNKQSVFKRARLEGEERPAKKVKL
jgi:DNA/RNA-binding protein KIN17